MITVSKLIPLSFLSIGIILLMQVILPVVSFHIWMVGQKFNNDILLISPNSSKREQVLGVSIENKNNFPAFISDLGRSTRPNYEQFTLSIPKLKIIDAKVLVDSNELTRGLVHLPGSALPGEKGNVFISGHSALSPLFIFKQALFANLKDLKKDDEIVIEAAGAKFKYKVSELKVVDPKDLSVINPPDASGRYISLMTCVPPGLNYKRLVVLGKMI